MTTEKSWGWGWVDSVVLAVLEKIIGRKFQTFCQEEIANLLPKNIAMTEIKTQWMTQLLFEEYLPDQTPLKVSMF